MNKKTGIDWAMLAVTVVAGFAAFAAGEAILAALKNAPHAISAAAYFGAASAIIAGFTCFCAIKLSPGRFASPYRAYFGRALAGVMIFSLSLPMAAGALFQLIYNAGRGESGTAKNFIVAIDSSGSMAQNDPEFERFEALKELFVHLEPDQTICVYSFNSIYSEIFPAQAVTQNIIDNFDEIFAPYKLNSGGTDIMGPLADIARRQADSPPPGGAAAIVISDGECEVWEGVLKECSDARLPVHTVGVSHVNIDSLNLISRRTGGVYQNVGDAGGLASILQGLAKTKYANFLAGRRAGPPADSLLFAILRVFLLFLLGLTIRTLQYYIIDDDFRKTSRLVQSAACALLGALFVELALQSYGLDEPPARFIMLLLFAAVLRFLYTSLE